LSKVELALLLNKLETGVAVEHSGKDATSGKQVLPGTRGQPWLCLLEKSRQPKPQTMALKLQLAKGKLAMSTSAIKVTSGSCVTFSVNSLRAASTAAADMSVAVSLQQESPSCKERMRQFS
jgi:hypothetical protein